MRILLDITRTVARTRLPRATGIDRVERAYIGWALAREAVFLAHVDGEWLLVGAEGVETLLAVIDGDAVPGMDWRARLSLKRDPTLRRAQSLMRHAALARAGSEKSLAAMLASRVPTPAISLNTGHDNLLPPVFAALGSAGIIRAVLLHDVIPLDHPHFARAGTVDKFRARFAMALSADALIFNSRHTADRVENHANGPLPPHRVLPLGIGPAVRIPNRPLSEPPEFVTLGTIEPRKNHALLFEVWHRLVARHGQAAPRLRIIGRRGWAGPDVIGFLDRDSLMGDFIREDGPLSDAATADVLRGARALVFPSLAEGYGLPVAEALRDGVPVICSDLPALREVAKEVPDWLPPDDPEAWVAMIERYCNPASPARAAQLARLEGWSPPTWDAHFSGLANFLETIMVHPAPDDAFAATRQEFRG